MIVQTLWYSSTERSEYSFTCLHFLIDLYSKFSHVFPKWSPFFSRLGMKLLVDYIFLVLLSVILFISFLFACWFNNF